MFYFSVSVLCSFKENQLTLKGEKLNPIKGLMLFGEVSDFRARTGKTQGRAGSSYNDKNKEVLI